MSERDTIKYALYDAIAWQLSLADAQHKGSSERRESLAQAKAYRSVLKRRYGDDRLPMEIALEGTKIVTLDELRLR